MNPFDPALEKSVGTLVANVRSAGQQCQAVPSVEQAIGHVSMLVHCFYRDLRDEFLRKVLAGEGPNAKVLSLVHHKGHTDYSWDLIKQVRREPLRMHPDAAFHKAFCDYVNWTRRQLKGDGELGPNDTPFTHRTYKLGVYQLAFPERSVVYAQGTQTGEVHLTYSVPDLEVTEIAIQSDLEGLPLTNQLNCSGVGLEMDFDLDYDRFWRKYYCKDDAVWEQDYQPLMFPTVVPREAHPGATLDDDIIIRLRNFVVLAEEDGGVSLADGVITLTRATWVPCGYEVSVCNFIGTLFRGIRGDRSMSWDTLPRVLQALLHQIELTAGQDLTVDVTNPSLHTFKATVVSTKELTKHQSCGCAM